MLRSAASNARTASAGRAAESLDEDSKSAVPGSGSASIALVKFVAAVGESRSGGTESSRIVVGVKSQSRLSSMFPPRVVSHLTFTCQELLEQLCSPLCNGRSCLRVGLHGPDADSMHRQHGGDAVWCLCIQQDLADVGCTRSPASAQHSRRSGLVALAAHACLLSD